MIFVAILVVAIARILKPLHLDMFTTAIQSCQRQAGTKSHQRQALNQSITQSLSRSVAQSLSHSLTYTSSLAMYLDLPTFFQALSAADRCGIFPRREQLAYRAMLRR